MDMQLIAHQVSKIMRHGHRSMAMGRTCRAYGLDLLDNGCYGAAFLHRKTGLVLKVSFTVSDGTMPFIAKCAEHFRKHGKAPQFCPEVYAFGRDRHRWWAWMEHVDVGYTGSDYNSRGVEDAIISLMGGCRNFTSSGKVCEEHFDLGFDIHGGNYGTAKCGRHVVFDPFGSYTKLVVVPSINTKIVPKKQHGPAQGRWAC